MKQLNAFWESDKYIALNNAIGSTGYVKQSMSGEEITEEMLQHLHDRVIVCKGLRSNVSDYGDFGKWVEWFEEKMWPLLKEKAHQLPGLYHFYMEMAIYSDAVLMFDYDAWTNNLATACLLAHGITHDINGNMMAIRMDDPMLVYIRENSSLQFMRYRSKKAQEQILQLKRCRPDETIRVGVFGGGAEPALWLDGVSLEGVEVIVYDLNPVMKGVLEQVMEQPLQELNIDYWTQSFMNAFGDESLFGTFDLIIYNGVMSYYPEKKFDIAMGTQRLLKVGGIMFFDDILMHPDMAFGLKVRGWTVELKPEENLDVALEKNKKILPEAGFVYDDDHYECQDVRGIPNVLVSYAIKQAV